MVPGRASPTTGPAPAAATTPTFGFSYQVYGPNGKSVFPTNGGAGLGTFSKAVHSGDSVLLSLTFTGIDRPDARARLEHGRHGEDELRSRGLVDLRREPDPRPPTLIGFFTGLMTEWYHVLPYTANEGKVTYTNNAVRPHLGVDVDRRVRNGGPCEPPVFINQTQTPVIFANEQQVYPFASNGATIYSSAHQFITGLVNTASSRVMLTPAVAETTSPVFEASYVLAGLKQNSEVASGMSTVVEADPGTSVTISVNSSASSALESWVFSSGSAGSSVTFKIGANVTYVYYHLLLQLVSYRVVSGSPPPSSTSPVLTYWVPPPAASETPSQVAANQPLSSSPVTIYALLGSAASIQGPIPGVAGERWIATSQNWTVSGPDSIPMPIDFFHQYQVSAGYTLIGGGIPPNPPEINSTAFGSPAALPIPGNETTLWFDAGSVFSFTSVMNGSSPGERWIQAGGFVSGNNSGNFTITNSPRQAPLTIAIPNQAISLDYKHQYYATLGVNDARGGVISQGSGWFDAGNTLNASASANPQWQFQIWNGTGVASYSGTSPTLALALKGPVSEQAVFYVQLALEADKGTRISYSYGSQTGSVQPGTTKDVYVPSSSSVTLRESPSLFVYSFTMWEGTGDINSTNPSISLVVNSPTAVIATSAYNFPLILGAAAGVLIVVLSRVNPHQAGPA